MMKGDAKSEVRTLLLIDDEPDIIQMIFAALDKPGTHILLAQNGREALDVLQDYPVDAILSDVRMPQMSGIEMTKEVRTLGLATPIVLMSGFVDYETTIDALRAGVLDIIEKPFSRDKLVAAVEHALVLGANVRKIHSDIKKFAEDRRIDTKYIDIMKYLSIFLAQQEVERAKRVAMKSVS